MYLFLTALSPFMHTRPVMALFHETHDPADLRAASRRAILRAVWVQTSAATGAACPVLLVAGEKEGYVRPADAALATLMPHAEARFAPGLGHCWQRKAPDLHIRMVEAWVTGQELPFELQREPAPSPAAVERMRAIARPQGGMHVHESGTPGSPAIVFIHGVGQSGRSGASTWRGSAASTAWPRTCRGSGRATTCRRRRWPRRWTSSPSSSRRASRQGGRRRRHLLGCRRHPCPAGSAIPTASTARSSTVPPRLAAGPGPSGSSSSPRCRPSCTPDR